MEAVRTAPRPFLTVKEVMILLGCKEDFAYKTMTLKLNFAEPVTKSSGSTQTSSEHKIGDVVQFNGGYHYVNSTASKPTGSRCNAGPAKITHIAKGKAHPWHLEHTDSKSRVFGWVDDGTFS